MTGPSRNDTSLAFVDVITNGLGGMLVLFFIVVLVQSQLEWGDPAESSKESGASDMQPFVLIVKSTGDTSVFDPGSGQSVWNFEGVPPGMIATQRGTQWDWGRSYAIFVANRPLGLNAVASIRTPGNAADLEVDLYPSGASKQSYTVRSRPGSTWTEVWPAVGFRSE